MTQWEGAVARDLIDLVWPSRRGSGAWGVLVVALVLTPAAALGAVWGLPGWGRAQQLDGPPYLWAPLPVIAALVVWTALGTWVAWRFAHWLCLGALRPGRAAALLTGLPALSLLTSLEMLAGEFSAAPDDAVEVGGSIAALTVATLGAALLMPTVPTATWIDVDRLPGAAEGPGRLPPPDGARHPQLAGGTVTGLVGALPVLSVAALRLGQSRWPAPTTMADVVWTALVTGPLAALVIVLMGCVVCLGVTIVRSLSAEVAFRG